MRQAFAVFCHWLEHKLWIQPVELVRVNGDVRNNTHTITIRCTTCGAEITR